MALAVNPGDPITAGLWNALVASVDGKPNGNFGVDTSGSSSNYAVTLDPAPSAYFSGLGVVFVTQAACAGGGVTLNLNGLGPVPIKKQGSLDLEAGDLGASQAAEVCYDGSVFQLLSCASLTTAVGDLVAGGSGGVTARVPGNTSTTKAFLTQTGDGTASASPAWGTIAAADVPTLDAIRQPVADVSLNSQHITSLSDPVNAQDAATKSWVQSVVPQAFTAGMVLPFAGFTAPSSWVFCDGSAYDRTGTMATLFAAITLTASGTLTSGTAVVTGLSGTASMFSGMPVEGSGVPSGTTISSVDSSSQITLSQNATSSGSSTLTFFPYGNGDGSTTFNVPDLRGKAPIGAGQGSVGGTTLTDRVAGQDGGEEAHHLTVSELASHNHTATDGGHTHSASDSGHTHPKPSGATSFIVDGLSTAYAGSAATTWGSSANTGSGAANVSVSTGYAAVTVGDTGSGAAHNTMQPWVCLSFIIRY